MNVFYLFKLQLDEKMDLFRSKNKKAMIKSLILGVAIVLIAVAAIYLLTGRMKTMGITFGRETLSLVLLATQIIAFLLSLGSIISTLYTNKDNELLMSMPASHNEVFLSKILVLYVSEAYANTLYTLPICISFGILGGYPAAFYLSLPLMLILLPVIPLALASFVSLPVFAVMSFLKKHLILSVVTIAAVAAVAIWGYASLVSGLTDVFNITGKQIETVTKINGAIVNFAKYNVIYMWAADSMFFDGFVWKYPVLLFGSLALFACGMLICKPFYFKLAMKNAETGESALRKKTKSKLMSPAASLFVKEFKTVFRSPGYVFQYFIFTLLMPFIVITYDKLLLSITVSQIGYNMIDGAHLMIVAIIAMLSNVLSATALSREGGNFYLMKTSPVDVETQAYVKVAFNAVFTVAAVIVTCVMSAIFYKFVWWKTLLGCIAICLVSAGHICMCFQYDLLKPSLDWYDTSEITSLSKSTAKGIAVGMVLAALMGFFLMRFSYSNVKAYTYLIVFSVLFCLIEAYMLRSRLLYYFDKMEV